MKLNSKGLKGINPEIKIKPAKLRTISNIRFAFKLYSKANRSNFQLDTSNPNWQRIKSGILVRDRITHPKSLADLTVSSDEFTASVQAFLWFDDQIIAALEATTSALQLRVSKLKDQMSSLDLLAAIAKEVNSPPTSSIPKVSLRKHHDRSELPK